MTKSTVEQAQEILAKKAPKASKKVEGELVEEQETALVVTGLDTHDQVVAVYTSETGLSDQVDQVRDLIQNFDHNMKNLKGRNATKSLASKVGKFKARLEKVGKSLTDAEKAKIEDVQATISLINKNVKDMSQALKELKIEARKPLTEWEEKKEAEKEAKAQKELDEKMALLHENALFMNEKFDADREAEKKLLAEQAEQERLAEEKRIAEKAVADAEIEAEQLKQKIADAEKEAQRLQAEKEANTVHYWYHHGTGKVGFVVGNSERDKLVQYTDAELCDKAKYDQVIAEQENAKLVEQQLAYEENLRIKKQNEEQQRLINEQKQQAKLAEEQAHQLALEQEQKRKNNEYVAKVCGALKQSIMLVGGVSEPQAKAIVIGLRDGAIDTFQFNNLFNKA